MEDAEMDRNGCARIVIGKDTDESVIVLSPASKNEHCAEYMPAAPG